MASTPQKQESWEPCHSLLTHLCPLDLLLKPPLPQAKAEPWLPPVPQGAVWLSLLMARAGLYWALKPFPWGVGFLLPCRHGSLIWA
jgi:hypothetical protein